MVEALIGIAMTVAVMPMGMIFLTLYLRARKRR